MKLQRSFYHRENLFFCWSHLENQDINKIRSRMAWSPSPRNHIWSWYHRSTGLFGNKWDNNTTLARWPETHHRDTIPKICFWILNLLNPSEINEIAFSLYPNCCKPTNGKPRRKYILWILTLMNLSENNEKIPFSMARNPPPGPIIGIIKIS